MQWKTLNVLLITFLIFISTTAFAQKIFSVSIHLPKQLINQRIELSYDNGKTEKTIPHISHSDTITISDSFYSKFVSIKIRIDSNSFNLPHYNTFFVSDKPASITVTTNSLQQFKLINAYDVRKMGENKLNTFAADEESAVADFYSKPPAENDSTWGVKNEILIKKLIDKKLDFIKQNKNLYYSFWLFRKDIAPNIFTDPDSLFHFYNTTFASSLRRTLEGKEVMEILHGRKISISENMMAPNFKAIDISGNLITLQNEIGKYVLINFWASWCGPCVAELPAIKKISDKYSPGKLKVISISFDNDSTKFLNAIKENKMVDWTNIYRDSDMAKKFGVTDGLPMVYLIDPNGKIIYNREFETDYVKLARLNQILERQLR